MNRSFEIERKYLLSGMPALPGGAEVLQIEQGYMADGGRLRRAVAPDGTVTCTHTVKRGGGLVREERERVISSGEFDALWPRTAPNRRLRKARYRVAEGGLVWEIDEYPDLDLLLAEVELPSAATPVTPPAWLAPVVVRDVTEEPEYSNYELALRRKPRRRS